RITTRPAIDRRTACASLTSKTMVADEERARSKTATVTCHLGFAARHAPPRSRAARKNPKSRLHADKQAHLLGQDATPHPPGKQASGSQSSAVALLTLTALRGLSPTPRFFRGRQSPAPCEQRATPGCSALLTAPLPESRPNVQCREDGSREMRLQN